MKLNNHKGTGRHCGMICNVFGYPSLNESFKCTRIDILLKDNIDDGINSVQSRKVMLLINFVFILLLNKKTFLCRPGFQIGFLV